jgi:DNA-binding CsgD family transcriptional regulator
VEARGGVSAVAAFLERAATLTPDPTRRVRRQLRAAAAKRDGGDLDAALILLRDAEAGQIDEIERGRAELLRAHIAQQQRRAEEAGSLFMSAASRFQSPAPELARETYLEVLGGTLARDVAVPGGAGTIAAAARSTSVGTGPRSVDAMLDALSIRLTEGYAASVPALARALELVIRDSQEESGRPLSFSRLRDADMVALELWNADASHLLAAREVQVTRETGAVGQLQFALSFLARSNMLAGDLSTAELLLDESRVIAEAIGGPPLVNAPIILAVLRGDEGKASEMIEASSEEAASRRWRASNYARSVFHNSLGRHDAAFDAAREALQWDDPIAYGTLLVPELAEAASRIGDGAGLAYAVQWLSERARILRSGWVSGIDARARALASDGDMADRLYRESIEHLSGTRMRLDLARTRLLYGEWLRRERRRADAREHLRTALEQFTAIGAEAFAHRAERELLATGARARKRTVDTLDQLTPQETHIARLAAQGETNREIAARLFISASTVEYHLHKVFRKLGVKSRTQLARRVP